MTSEALRASPAFAATEIVTVLDPVPLPPDVMATHGASARAVHAQPAIVVTAIRAVPPAAPKLWSPADNSNRQGAASCRICARAPLTTTSPWRALAVGFAATVTFTSPVPCPEAGVTPVIQFASEDALQVHSACVLTATVADDPPESIDAAGAVTLTPHFAGDGLVDEATVDPQPADTHAIHTAMIGTKR